MSTSGSLPPHLPAPALRGSAGSLGLAAAMAAVAAAAMLVWLGPIERTPGQVALACLLGIVGFAPLLSLLFNQVTRYPLGQMTVAYHGVTFGVLALLPGVDWRFVSEEDITYALSVSLIATALLGLGCAAGRHLPPLHDRFKGTRSIELHSVAMVLVAAKLTGYAVPALKNVPTLPHLLETGSWIGYILLLCSLLRGQLGGIQAVFLWGAIGIDLVYRLATGSLANVAILFLVLALVQWRERGKIPWAAVLFAAAAFLILNPAKSAWRQEIWYGDRELGTVDRIESLANAVLDHYSPNAEAPEPADLDHANVNRLANIATFAWVRSVCPEVVGYWQGHTFGNLLYSLVPRFLYPEKPVGNGGNEFGRRYLLLDADDFYTSFNLPWVVDFYVNFGAVGVFIGMAIAGLLLGALGTAYGGRCSDVHYAIGVAATHQLFLAESNFSLMWGNVVLEIAAFTILLRLLINRRRPAQAGATGGG